MSIQERHELTSTCVIIPMKNPSDSKQRMRPLLDDGQRAALALKLYRNTLQFFKQEFPQLTVVVVTPSAHIAQVARMAGHQVLQEFKASGLNRALERATQWSIKHNFHRQLIIPADIAELDKQEISSILKKFPYANGVVIGRAKDGGTNALLCSPADAITFCYGRNSAHLHAQSAQLSSVPYEVMDLKKLSADVDYPKDLTSTLFNELNYAVADMNEVFRYA